MCPKHSQFAARYTAPGERVGQHSLPGRHRQAAPDGDQDIDAERNRERAKELRSRFVGEKDPASLIESSRLNLSKTDDAFYQHDLVQLRAPINPRGLPQSNALLWRCFRYFSAQLDALDDIQEDGEAFARILSETAARCLLFILITVEDEFDAYTVFETLNARGLELTTADLLQIGKIARRSALLGE